MTFKHVQSRRAGYLGDREHNVCGGDELVGCAIQLVSHDLRQDHADWLAQHDRLCFNPTHTYKDYTWFTCLFLPGSGIQQMGWKAVSPEKPVLQV